MKKIFFTDIVRVFVIFFCYIGALDNYNKNLYICILFALLGLINVVFLTYDIFSKNNN